MEEKLNFKVNLGHFGATTDEEKNKIMEERKSKNTNRATKSTMKILNDYLAEKGHPPLEEFPDNTLPDLFKTFYTDVRQVNGDIYKISSLKCIRAGINRHLKETRNIDIISDVRFVQANEMFKGIAKQAQIQGKGSTKSKILITDEDMGKIGRYFDHDLMNNPNPKLVQQCVLFYVLYFFCCHGRENLYEMTLDTFEINTDPDGTRYVTQVLDEHDKNHGIDETDPANQARMYENPDVDLCPVNIFSLYLSKLNKDYNHLWQKPKKNVHYTDDLWYSKLVVGHNPLSNFMKNLCVNADLSSRYYTNHSIRATCITNLDRSGFEARHIIAVSSHKSETTIKQYAKKCPDSKKREMSEALADKIIPKKYKIKQEPSCSIPIPTQCEVIYANTNTDKRQPDLGQMLNQPQTVLAEQTSKIQTPTKADELNLTNMDMQLVPIDNFDNDDQALIDFLDKVDSEIQKENTTKLPQTINNTITNNPQSIAGFIPKMFFPHSNVTINYNFGK